MSPVRYDEDYASLAERPPSESPWWVPWKYISLPLGSVEPAYLSLGAELWTRAESFEDLGWGENEGDTYLWMRFLPHADLHVGGLRAFAQLIAAGSLGVELASPVDENAFDVLQGFVEVDAWPAEARDLTVRFGRQLLSLGSGRLVDVRYGVNVLEPFEGARLMFDIDWLQFDGLYVRPVETAADAFDDGTVRGQALFGVYATVYLRRRDDIGFDIYYLGFENDEAVFQNGEGSEERHTLGVRAFGAIGALDYNYEVFLQFGSLTAESDELGILAWSVATDTQYTFAKLPGRPKLRLRANLASGDDDRDDEQLSTFNPLFPKGKYFGELTPIGPSNLINLHPTLTVELPAGLTLSSAVVAYWRQSLDDAVYGLNGFVLREGASGDARWVGLQWDVVLEHRVDRSFDTVVSYSQFHAGSFIRRTGPDETIRFVAIEARFRF